MIEDDKVLIKKNDRTGLIICFTLIIFVVVFVSINGNKYSEYRKTFKGEAIGLATKIERSNKHTYLKYYFYSNKRILGEISITNYDLLVNKFYKVKYDINNPEENYIILEKELKPDSLTLVNAGFTKTKYYIYDGGVSCRYIEKSKWK